MTQQKPTKLPVLRSESTAEFLQLQTRLNLEHEPQGVIEEELFEDFVSVIWEIKRLRVSRINTIQLAYGPALRDLLKHLLADPRDPSSRAITDNTARVLAHDWLENDPAAKEEVGDILGRVGLDESAIEAEAMKLSIDHLQYFDRLLAMASARRDKLLRLVMDYRGSDFAKQLRERSDQILNEPQDPQPLDGGDADQKAAA